MGRVGNKYFLKRTRTMLFYLEFLFVGENLYLYWDVNFFFDHCVSESPLQYLNETGILMFNGPRVCIVFPSCFYNFSATLNHDKYCVCTDTNHLGTSVSCIWMTIKMQKLECVFCQETLCSLKRAIKCLVYKLHCVSKLRSLDLLLQCFLQCIFFSAKTSMGIPNMDRSIYLRKFLLIDW